MNSTTFQLAIKVGNRLREVRLYLTTAESCTGGGIASAITDVSGSSAWFDRGFVSYSNMAKTEMLGVPPALIDRYGAVSEQTARAMAEGALRHSRAQIALSVTGIAGPGGGTEEKPVGTVCFGWAVHHTSKTETRRFKGERDAVRQQTIEHALRELLNFIDDTENH